MGFGDELMALGECQAMHRKTGRKVAILDKRGNPRAHPLWRGWDGLATRLSPDVVTITNGPGARPYIESFTPERWAFRPYQPKPATLAWVRGDRRGAGRVIVEPTTKDRASPNKQWHGWQAMIDAAPGLPWAQVGPADTDWLNGVERIVTDDFEAAVNVLATARATVLHEGGLHHAAAAVGCRAVVLAGGFIGPDVTGYEGQRWIWSNDPEARGWRIPHEACAKAWAAITPDMAVKELEALL